MKPTLADSSHSGFLSIGVAWCIFLCIYYCCSFAQSCPTLCNPMMDCSTQGSPVLHYLPQFAQTHVHRVGDAIQPSHPLLSPSLPPSVFSSIRVFSEWISSLSQVAVAGATASASVLPTNIQGWFPLGLTGLTPCSQGTLKSLLQRHSSKASILWCSVFFMVQLSHQYMTTKKNYTFDYTDRCWQSDVSGF